MSGDQLEAIRRLTNGGMDYRSPLTILLIGATPRRLLRVGDMAALDQRIQLRYHIPAPALTAEEASGYLWRTCPWPGAPTPCSPTTPSALSRPGPRPAPGHKPARDHSPAGRLRCRKDHRRRILRPHRHQRGGRHRDRLTTTPPPRPPQPRPARRRAGFFTPRRPHRECRRHGHLERRRTRAAYCALASCPAFLAARRLAALAARPRPCRAGRPDRQDLTLSAGVARSSCSGWGVRWGGQGFPAATAAWC